MLLYRRHRMIGEVFIAHGPNGAAVICHRCDWYCSYTGRIPRRVRRVIVQDARYHDRQCRRSPTQGGAR
jgi:hypothetical protein